MPRIYKGNICSSEITPESVYLKRRDFMKGALVSAMGATSLSNMAFGSDELRLLNYQKVDRSNGQGFYTDEPLTPYDDVKRYNNFYEFGMDKTDPSRYAEAMQLDPWSIKVEGEVEEAASYNLEDVLSWVDIEERIYRLRCVEAWSMVIPWLGFPLAQLLKKFKPTAKAKYIQFETLERPSEMRGMRSISSTIDWPYREGLRMDEAMNPLTFMAVGLYGRELPKQDGAPIRLVVPW